MGVGGRDGSQSGKCPHSRPSGAWILLAGDASRCEEDLLRMRLCAAEGEARPAALEYTISDIGQNVVCSRPKGLLLHFVWGFHDYIPPTLQLR